MNLNSTEILHFDQNLYLINSAKENNYHLSCNPSKDKNLSR